MCCVESCTGGWVAQLLTDVAGSSDWFECGWVTYSNAAKIRDVGVDQRTLDEFGAVSEETAREMATGAIDISMATVSLAVTGIAGPGGGSIEKPIGTVCFSWNIADQVASRTMHFEGDRRDVRRQSVRFVLEELLNLLGESS